MALPILDGNQSATTLSSILTSGEHIPAHTVVSLGTQAITDISGAVSGSVVSISNFPATQTIAGTVTANLSSGTTANPIYNYILEGDNDIVIGNTNPLPISGTVTVGNSVTIGSLPAISGTVTANSRSDLYDTPNDQYLNRSALHIFNGDWNYPVGEVNPLPISGTVTANASFASTTATYPSQIVAIGYKDEINTGNITPVTNDAEGGLPVYLGGISVDGNNNAILPTWLDGQEALNVPVSGTVTVGNSVTIASLPSLAAGTAQIGSVTASVTNPVTVGAIVGPIGGSVFKGGSGSTDAIRALPYFSQNGSANYNELSTNNPLPIAGTITIGSLPAISGTVTANVTILDTNSGSNVVFSEDGGIFPDYGLQVGFVDNLNYRLAGSSHPFPISGTVTVGNSVTIASLPAISGTVTANLSISSTVITSGSFSSLSSATLVPENPARKMATVFNLGAGQLFINAGVTATTLGGGFMVALSSGDFYECDYTTTTLSAIFATAGTASWMSH
jgi:hypothetical protein